MRVYVLGMEICAIDVTVADLGVFTSVVVECGFAVVCLEGCIWDLSGSKSEISYSCSCVSLLFRELFLLFRLG